MVFFFTNPDFLWNYGLGGGFKHFLFSPLKLGKISHLTSIFFRWVETTNQWAILHITGDLKEHHLVGFASETIPLDAMDVAFVNVKFLWGSPTEKWKT